MKIVFILNNNFECITNNAVTTVLKHNPDAELYFLVNRDVSQEFRKDRNIIEYDSSLLRDFADMQGYEHVSADAYAKLLIPNYFNEKILYLDGDIVCRGSLDELWNADFNGNYIIGCKGINYSFEQARELDIDYYINAGVMLMNCKLMRKDNILNIV
jgi:lipopolysaccharide biosynthesis glycosyltransferase